MSETSIEILNIPWKEGNPGGHGRLSLRGKDDGYIGNVVNGSISHRDTLGCLSPAVDSSQPTCNVIQGHDFKIFHIKKNYLSGNIRRVASR